MSTHVSRRSLENISRGGVVTTSKTLTRSYESSGSMLLGKISKSLPVETARAVPVWSRIAIAPHVYIEIYA